MYVLNQISNITFKHVCFVHIDDGLNKNLKWPYNRHFFTEIFSNTDKNRSGKFGNFSVIFFA